MKNTLGLVLVSLLAVGCVSKEIEFRDFAKLTEPDLKALKNELAKPKPGTVKLKSGQAAHCTKMICHIAWVARSLTLHVNEETQVKSKKATGDFTLESEEVAALLASIATAHEIKGEDAGRMGNLGHVCSSTECKLSVFVAGGEPDEVDPAAPAKKILKSTNRGRVFRE